MNWAVKCYFDKIRSCFTVVKSWREKKQTRYRAESHRDQLEIENTENILIWIGVVMREKLLFRHKWEENWLSAFVVFALILPLLHILHHNLKCSREDIRKWDATTDTGSESFQASLLSTFFFPSMHFAATCSVTNFCDHLAFDWMLL